MALKWEKDVGRMVVRGFLPGLSQRIANVRGRPSLQAFVSGDASSGAACRRPCLGRAKKPLDAWYERMRFSFRRKCGQAPGTCGIGKNMQEGPQKCSKRLAPGVVSPRWRRSGVASPQGLGHLASPPAPIRVPKCRTLVRIIQSCFRPDSLPRDRYVSHRSSVPFPA